MQDEDDNSEFHKSLSYFVDASGFFNTRMTESPLKNILEMKRSLLTGLDFFLPLPVLGTSVHISFTFSSTMLQCLRKTGRRFIISTIVVLVVHSIEKKRKNKNTVTNVSVNDYVDLYSSMYYL